MEELLKYSSREFEIWKIRNNVQIYECLPNDSEKLKQRIWAERLLLEVEVLGNNIKLILALPRAFPYNLPSVYLHSKEDSKYKNLPHVDKNLFICTANPEQTVQNINNPIGICNEIIQIAKNILEQGTNKTNFSDFEDEFLAYWSEESQKTTFSIVEQSNEVKDIVVVKFKNSDGYLDYLLADSKLDATTWLSNIGIDTRADVDYERGVYFPIKTAQFHIPPQKNRGVVEFLKGNNLTSLYGKLNINKRPCIVLCEYKKDDTSMLFAWKHQEAQIFKQVGSKKQQVKTLDGFRKGCNKISRFELTGYAKDTPIIKIDVHNLRKDRIFLRSGNSLSVNQEFRINLIGCGSIGSFLMEKLMRKY